METILLWVVRLGVWALLFTPLIVTGGLFFPYTTGKNFFFRIVVEIVFGAWLGLVTLGSPYLPRKGPVLYAFSAFIGVLTLATIFSVDPYRSFWSNFERMEGLVTHLHLFVFFLVASSTLVKNREWVRIFQISLGVSALVSCIGFLEQMGAITLVGSVAGSGGAGRIFSTFGSSTFLAAYLLPHLFIAGYLFVCAQSRMARVAYAIAFLFELYILVASGTRGAMVGLLAGTAVATAILVFFSRNVLLRKSGVAVAGVVTLLVIGVFVMRDTQFIQSRPLLARFTDFDLSLSSPVLTSSPTLRARLMTWGMAWEGFKERPYMGWGLDNFTIPYARHYNPDHFGNELWSDRVHNVLLEWLVAGGILAITAYILFFTALGVVLWRLKKARVLSIEAVAIFAGLGIAHLAQNLFAFDTIATYLMLILLAAFLHGVSSSDAREKETYPVYKNEEWRMYLAPVLVAMGIIFAYVMHAGPIALASGMNNVFYLVAGSPATDFIKRYGVVRANGSFGLTELREQFTLYTISLMESQETDVSPQDKARILSKSIEEMEVEVQAHPQSVRPLLALGKLYQLRFLHAKDENDKNAALGVYTRALETASYFPQGSIGLAETCLAAGDPHKAMQTMDAIYNRTTIPNPPLLAATLLTHVAASDFSGAIKLIHEYRSYEDTLPEYATGVYVAPEDAEELARRSLDKGDPATREIFLVTLRDALGSANNNGALFFAIAKTQAELRKLEEARANANRAITADYRMRYEVREFLESLD
jgi:O-antigen ligase